MVSSAKVVQSIVEESGNLIKNKDKVKLKKAEDLLDKGKISASIVAKAKPEDCQGEDCCMTGTYFDTNTKKCTESFTNWSSSLGYSSI